MAAWIAPVLIIRFLRYQRPLKGWVISVLAGWISNIFIWRDMMPVSGIFYYVLVLMMSVFTSFTFIIDRIYSARLKGFVSTLVFPSAYVVMEYVTVSTNPSGSFGMLAHTQASLPLLQLVSVTGIWGVTFVILWTASVINWLWDNAFQARILRQAFWAYGAPVAGIILFGQIRLAQGTVGGTVKVASINVPKTELRHIYSGHPDPANDRINSAFLENCHVAATSKAKIAFGVEILINLTADNEDAFVASAKAVAVRDKIYIGLPLLVYSDKNPSARPVNKITWISPQGEILFSYCKAKPTPGEGSYGDGIIRHFDSPYGRIGSAICFDMDFPAFLHQVHSADIDIMLVPGNDWKTIAPYHTYVASFRALEQGFNLVRAASRGLSASFDHKGRLISSQNYFAADDVILYSDVPTRGSRTLYGMVGDAFAWGCILFLVLTSAFVLKKGLLCRKARRQGVEETVASAF